MKGPKHGAVKEGKNETKELDTGRPSRAANSISTGNDEVTLK